MLRCALVRDVIHNFVFKATPGSAIKVAILRYCITVSESGQHVIFAKRVDVSSIQVTFVKSLVTSSSSTVHFVRALSGESWNLKEKRKLIKFSKIKGRMLM